MICMMHCIASQFQIWWLVTPLWQRGVAAPFGDAHEQMARRIILQKLAGASHPPRHLVFGTGRVELSGKS